MSGMSPFPTSKGARIITSADLASHFKTYLRSLNMDLWSTVASYIAPRVVLSGQKLTAKQFISLIAPGALFSADMIVADMSSRTLAVRMEIQLPASVMREWVDLPGGPTSRHVTEHCFYHFNEHWRIDQVWCRFFADGEKLEGAFSSPTSALKW
jgi:predicted ester cyclase